MEGAYMFTFGLLAQMGLHATHTVDFQGAGGSRRVGGQAVVTYGMC